jgi:hypothetical protein
MKALFWVGLVILIFGVVSLVVPIRHGERQGVTVGGVSLGVETRTEDKVSPILSALMIAGGLAAIIAGKRTAS